MSMLSTFTPSLMTPETLEAIFVQREALAKRIVQDIRASATTAAKHHHLLIGPRGMGKTHLVSLVRHRVAQVKGLSRKLAVAWLREEEWGITSYVDLLLRVRDVLAESASEHLGRAAEGRASYGAPAGEEQVTAAIDAMLEGRTLLVIVENFDDILRALGRSGQEKLRAHLQNGRNWTILATAQSLAPAIQDHAAPFYGFFDVDHLGELSLAESEALLQALARHAGDAELARLLETPGGRARVRALRHLAGGNHRVHVIFSRFLTAASLADMSEPFLRTLDELTPYYQARMSWLSPQQRKIVEAICDARGPIAVRDLAKACRLTQQVTSSQLKQLRDLGYVVARAEGRESLHELREPLLRLVTDLKKQRGPTLRTLVEFLTIWYSLPDLEAMLQRARKTGMDFDADHVAAALDLSRRKDSVTDVLFEDLQRRVSPVDFLAWLDDAEALWNRRPDVAVGIVSVHPDIEDSGSALEEIVRDETWRRRSDAWRLLLALALVNASCRASATVILGECMAGDPSESEVVSWLRFWLDPSVDLDLSATPNYRLTVTLFAVTALRLMRHPSGLRSVLDIGAEVGQPMAMQATIPWLSLRCAHLEGDRLIEAVGHLISLTGQDFVSDVVRESVDARLQENWARIPPSERHRIDVAEDMRKRLDAGAAQAPPRGRTRSRPAR